jgi:hypothetical protein
MEEVLGSIATTLGATRIEKRPSPDYLWLKDRQLIVAVEHENNFGDDILEKELPALLRTEARLRVLITYPHLHQMPASDFATKIEKELQETLTPDKDPEFLLLLDSTRWAATPSEEAWSYYVWKFLLKKTEGWIA